MALDLQGLREAHRALPQEQINIEAPLQAEPEENSQPLTTWHYIAQYSGTIEKMAIGCTLIGGFSFLDTHTPLLHQTWIECLAKQNINHLSPSSLSNLCSTEAVNENTISPYLTSIPLLIGTFLLIRGAMRIANHHQAIFLQQEEARNNWKTAFISEISNVYISFNSIYLALDSFSTESAHKFTLPSKVTPIAVAILTLLSTEILGRVNDQNIAGQRDLFFGNLWVVVATAALVKELALGKISNIIEFLQLDDHKKQITDQFLSCVEKIQASSWLWNFAQITSLSIGISMLLHGIFQLKEPQQIRSKSVAQAQIKQLSVAGTLTGVFLGTFLDRQLGTSSTNAGLLALLCGAFAYKKTASLPVIASIEAPQDPSLPPLSIWKRLRHKIVNYLEYESFAYITSITILFINKFNFDKARKELAVYEVSVNLYLSLATLLAFRLLAVLKNSVERT